MKRFLLLTFALCWSVLCQGQHSVPSRRLNFQAPGGSNNVWASFPQSQVALEYYWRASDATVGPATTNNPWLDRIAGVKAQPYVFSNLFAPSFCSNRADFINKSFLQIVPPINHTLNQTCSIAIICRPFTEAGLGGYMIAQDNSVTKNSFGFLSQAIRASSDLRADAAWSTALAPTNLYCIVMAYNNTNGMTVYTNGATSRSNAFETFTNITTIGTGGAPWGNGNRGSAFYGGSIYELMFFGKRLTINDASNLWVYATNMYPQGDKFPWDNPLTSQYANLESWLSLDFSQHSDTIGVMTTNGQVVSWWGDATIGRSTANGDIFSFWGANTTTATPTYLSSGGPNGRPYLICTTNTTGYGVVGSIASGIPVYNNVLQAGSVSTVGTWFWVGKPGDLATATRIAFSGNRNNDPVFENALQFINGAGNSAARQNGTAILIPGANYNSYGSYVLFTIVFNGASSLIRTNGVQAATGNPTGTTWSSPQLLMERNGANRFFNGNFADFMHFKTALTAAEIDTVETNYYKPKFNLW